MSRIQTGDSWRLTNLKPVSGSLTVPNPRGWTHLQFRRYAGCPICNLHLRQFIRRKEEIVHRRVFEVIVFASTEAAISSYAADIPFPIVADPHRRLYSQLGLERSPWAVLPPKVMIAAMRGLLAFGAAFPEHWADATATPADFLIDSSGIVQACNYGRHADDQWTVDEILALVPEPGPTMQSGSAASRSHSATP